MTPERPSLLGHEFADGALLEEALTTPSCRMDRPNVRDNQRLEFLGDAVLGLLAAERLYGAFPREQEGPLTVMRTHMVSTSALCEAADRLGLVPQLKRAAHLPPLAKDAKTVADAVEAIIGAAYLDGGFAAAHEVFDALALTAGAAEDEWSENPKGELQVRAQAMHPPRHPVYTLLSTAGKAHEPIFTVKVFVEGLGEATASARTHKAAEAKAAAELLKGQDSIQFKGKIDNAEVDSGGSLRDDGGGTGRDGRLVRSAERAGPGTGTGAGRD